MKINDTHPSSATEVGGTASVRRRPDGTPQPGQTGPNPASGPAAAPAAKVELSARSRELHQARAQADAAPDVRADKVADARTRISEGTYTVDADRIARQIVDRRA